MEDAVPNKQNGKKRSKKEVKEEQEDLRNDAELNAILNDSGIIKQFGNLKIKLLYKILINSLVGSQLVGKEKRKFQKDQLKELGMKVIN
jgi:hypothetical protein